MKANKNVADDGSRAPPLDIVKGQEVLVVNGDRSSLTWKRYNLIEINQRTGMCIVEGIANGQQRNFPRSVVKPKDWIDKFKLFFRSFAAIDDDDEKDQKNDHHSHHYVEFMNFKVAMHLLGAQYNHSPALKIFKALDVRANGILSFNQFMNWVYGLGRVADRGRLLTTIECVIGLRKWRNALPYYVLEMEVGNDGRSDNKMEGDQLINNSDRSLSWIRGTYDQSKTTASSISLITDKREFLIPCNLNNFAGQLRSTLSTELAQISEKYYPTNEDDRECSIVVMGPGEIGKSALINKFVKGIFPHDYDPTIQDHLRKQILVDDKPSLLDILDTAGQDEFASMRYDWLQENIDVLLICFSRSDHESFIAAEELINISKRLLKQHKKPRIVPILLVATKEDLSLQGVEVTPEEVLELQERYGGETFVSYVECSAFMDEGVSEVFDSAVVLYRKWREENAGIDVKYPTLREVQQLRRMSALQTMNSKAHQTKSKCISCIAWFCPATAAYLDSGSSDINNKRGKLAIARVPIDKFGDELASPSYSKKQFFVRRDMSWNRCGLSILTAIFFPFVLAYQTILFLCYCKFKSCSGGQCCYKCLPRSADFTETNKALLFDFLGIVVGRDPRESAKDDDSRKWFLSQTCGQKCSRILVSSFIILVFVFAYFNAATLGLGFFADDSEEADDSETTKAGDLSLMEYMGPLQLWTVMWIVLSLYLSLSIYVTPSPPNMQSLRPMVMYLNYDESIRTTAYVFLRGFSKSTLQIFRLEATTERVLSGFIVASIWCCIPGLVRTFLKTEGGGEFFPSGAYFETITSMIVNFTFLFFLTLGLQMQLLSGLVKYIDWMDDITSMLDEEFAAQKKLNYLNLTRHNNTLAWIEMRTYLYTKGLIIFSRQEIFVLYVISLQVFSAFYTIWRLMSEARPEDAYGSPSFVGVLFGFFLLTYALIRILRTTRIIERLQIKQIALLSSQKFQIYYKRITWHPDEEQQSNDMNDDEGDGDNDGGLFDDDLGINFNSLPPLDDNIDYSDDDDDSNDDKNDQNDDNIQEEEKEKEKLIIVKDDDAAPAPAVDTLPLNTDNTAAATTLTIQPNKLKLQRTATNYKPNLIVNNGESMFSAEYLEQSEKFVQSVITICDAQDIIPRVFNIKINVAVGLSVLCTVFAVLPTAGRLAFGSDCGTWSD